MSHLSSKPASPGLLRRGDQVAVAALVVTALVAMIGWWASQGGHGRLVEAERARPLTARFAVDVNTADQQELQQLPGIGETLAQRIIESRTARGPFLLPDDLRRVKGIGAKRLEHIQPYLAPMTGSGSTP